MQSLSDQLVMALQRDGGRVHLRHRAVKLERDHDQAGWLVTVDAHAQGQLHLKASEIVCSLPPQCLPGLIPDPQQMPEAYRNHLDTLKAPSGAIVFYGAVERHHLPDDCPGHLQRDQKSPGSLFLSVSHDGDGRAPEGQATVIASVFTSPEGWLDLDEKAYQKRKKDLRNSIRAGVNAALNLPDHAWLHQELATPRGFAHWTGRPHGVVGGLGQSPGRFGPFGLASRTPVPGLWLCGDSIHPGEGTAGVSLSALMACRQLMASRGLSIRLAD